MVQVFPRRLRCIVAIIIFAAAHPVLFGEGFLFEDRDISALTDPSVRDIATDSRGYIWAATPRGLIQYDGQVPILRDNDNIPELPSEDILSLEFSEEGRRLWIGTDAGLVRHDFQNGESEEVRLIHSGRQSGSREVIDLEFGNETGLFALTNDAVYAAVRSGNSDYSDGLGQLPANITDNAAHVFDIAMDGAGTLWAASSEGLEKWSADISRFVRVVEFSGARCVEAIGSVVWAGNDAGRVLAYDPSEGSSKVYSPGGRVTDFAGDSGGLVWIATGTTGLVVLDPATGEYRRPPVDSDHPFRLSSARITSLYSDGDLVWIGTMDYGLFSVDVRKSNNLEYTRRSGANGLPGGPVRVIYEDSLGYLWIGSDVGGLARVDPYQGQIRQYVHDDSDFFSIGSDHITAVLEDSAGRVWVGTDLGLAVYISEIEGFEHPEGMFGDVPDTRGSRVVAIAEGGDGSIYISMEDGRVHVLDLLERDYDTFPFRSDTEPEVFLSDRFGSVWAGSRTNLRLFGSEGKLVETWSKEDGNLPDQLAGGITAIFADSRDRNWFGGSGGLAVYPSKGEDFIPITLPDGSDIDVSGITEDRDGNIWVANGREIHVFDSSLSYLRTVGSDCGFRPSGPISSVGRSSSGRILVGSNGQVWTFDGIPELVENSMPDVHILSVRVGDDDVIQAGGLTEHDPLVIQPGVNSLLIEFGVVDFSDSDTVRYQQKMSSIDEQWHDTDRSRQVYYANLDYGDAVFSLRSFDTKTGVIGDIATLNIRVNKPWWRQGWAMLLLIAFVSGIVAVIVKLREGVLLKGQVHALEEARRATLAANQKLEFLTMNDTLTGLLNRRGFDSAMEHALSTASRNELMISVIMLDVDFFKRYNDNYGHVRGDECLRNVGRALRSVFTRPTDIVARYGGEEFTVVFVGDNRTAVVTLVNELVSAIRDLDIVHEHSDVSDRLTLSAGSATIMGTDDLSEKELVDLSDKALYAAKNGGRNRVCFTGILPELPGMMKNGTKPLVLGANAADG